MDQIDTRAQRVGERVEAWSGNAQVDDALDGDSRGVFDVRLALRGVGRSWGTDALSPTRKGKIGLRHGREGEVAPEQVALRPLGAGARSVGEGETHAGLEILGGPLAELHLQRLLALGHLRVAGRERRREEKAGAQQSLLSSVDGLRSEHVPVLQPHQVKDEALDGPSMPDDLHVPDSDDRARLDAVPHVHA